MALYNHLYARKHEGKWIMRVEDTDAVCLLVNLKPVQLMSERGIDVIQTRFVPGSVDGIRKALEWAGLEYDYGQQLCANSWNRLTGIQYYRPRERRASCALLPGNFMR